MQRTNDNENYNEYDMLTEDVLSEYYDEISIANKNIAPINQPINFENNYNRTSYNNQPFQQEKTSSHSFQKQETKVEEEVKQRKKDNRRLLPLLLAALILGTSIGAGYRVAAYYIPQKQVAMRYITETADGSTLSTDTKAMSIADIAEKYRPAIVEIDSVGADGFFGQSRVVKSSGTGVVFSVDDDDIYIITNNHVIEDSTQKPTVQFDEKNKTEAEIIGADNLSDLALLKVKVSRLEKTFLDKLIPVSFANSDKLKIGDTVVAIGNPLGYEDTVTVGTVSGLNRHIVANDSDLRLIQTDAAINSGNSGGALLDTNGHLIGINTLKIKQEGVEGLGFAIPSNEVKEIMENIMEKGYVERAFLGVSGRGVTASESKEFSLPLGIFVENVFINTAASDGGLIRGDIITAIDGSPIETIDELTEFIKGKKVGDKIILKVYRQSYGYKKIEVTLKQRPNF